jgi:hypothetical protein
VKWHAICRADLRLGASSSAGVCGFTWVHGWVYGFPQVYVDWRCICSWGGPELNAVRRLTHAVLGPMVGLTLNVSVLCGVRVTGARCVRVWGCLSLWLCLGIARKRAGVRHAWRAWGALMCGV